MDEELCGSDVPGFTVDLEVSNIIFWIRKSKSSHWVSYSAKSQMIRWLKQDKCIDNSPVTNEKVTDPFSPASKSLANMFANKAPAGKPDQICNTLKY